MPFFFAIAAALTSFKVCNFVTHPDSKVRKKMPHVKIKKLELLPSLRVQAKGRVIHLHHWFNFSILLCASIFVTGGILDSWITRGALVGGILQGLSVPNTNTPRKIVYRELE